MLFQWPFQHFAILLSGVKRDQIAHLCDISKFERDIRYLNNRVYTVHGLKKEHKNLSGYTKANEILQGQRVLQ